MMKKYIAAAVLSITVLGALAGCGNAGNTGNNAGNAGNVSNAGSAANAGNTEAGTVSGAENGNTGNANVAVSLDAATKTALDRVPGATEQDIRIKLDYDDGRQKYEGDIIYQQVEYDFEIDADTGEVIEWSEERG